MQLPPIAATTVGSFPRPNWLAVSERTLVKFRLEGADLKEAQDDVTRLNMVDQEQIGLDLITDGEQRRPGFIHHILAAFDGMDLDNQSMKTVYRRREQPRLVPRVVGKIKRRAPAARCATASNSPASSTEPIAARWSCDRMRIHSRERVARLCDRHHSKGCDATTSPSDVSRA